MAVWFMERDLVPDLTYQNMKKESSLTFYWNVQKLDTEKQEGMLNVLWSLTFKPEKTNLMISILAMGGGQISSREILNFVFGQEMRQQMFVWMP